MEHKVMKCKACDNERKLEKFGICSVCLDKIEEELKEGYSFRPFSMLVGRYIPVGDFKMNKDYSENVYPNIGIEIKEKMG